MGKNLRYGLVAAVFFTAVFFGCSLFFPSDAGSSTTTTLPPGTGPSSTRTEQISVTGGAISLPDSGGQTAIQLNIAEGTVAADTAFSVAEYTVADTAMGNIYRFEPAGVTFKKPIKVTIGYGDFARKSQLADADIGLYQLSDAGYLVPVFGAALNTASKTISYYMSHFSGVALGSKAALLTAAMTKQMASLTACQISPEYIALCNELYTLYTTTVTDYFDRASFVKGFDAVKAWCDGRPELKAGKNWVGSTGPSRWADKVVAGYELIVTSMSADYVRNTTTNFIQRGYSNDRRGEIIPVDMYYVCMGGQIREVQDTVSGTDSLECFDIYIKKTLSDPRLTVNQQDLILLEENEVHGIEATVDYKYLNQGTDADYLDTTPQTGEGYLGFEGAVVGFEITGGGGTLSVATATTDAAGRAQDSYTAKWGTTQIEPETATVRAKIVQGELAIYKDITITEAEGGAVPRVVSMSPAADSIDVEPGTAIVVSFSKPMDRVSVQAAFHCYSWLLGEMPGTFAWESDSRFTYSYATMQPPGDATDVQIVATATDKDGKPLELEYLASLYLKGLSSPLGQPVFTDEDADPNQLGGTLVFYPAIHEKSLDSYRIYWSEDGTTKLGSLPAFAEVSKQALDVENGLYTLTIPSGTVVPLGGLYFIVYSAKGLAECETPAAVATADLGIQGTIVKAEFSMRGFPSSTMDDESWGWFNSGFTYTAHTYFDGSGSYSYSGGTMTLTTGIPNPSGLVEVFDHIQTYDSAFSYYDPNFKHWYHTKFPARKTSGDFGVLAGTYERRASFSNCNYSVSLFGSANGTVVHVETFNQDGTYIFERNGVPIESGTWAPYNVGKGYSLNPVGAAARNYNVIYWAAIGGQSFML